MDANRIVIDELLSFIAKEYQLNLSTDCRRVTGVAIGGPENNTLFAICMNKIWKRKTPQHSMGAFSPWTKVTPNKL